MSTNKTAIVTGASRGIGSAIAKRLAKDGFSVIVNYLKSKEDAQRVVSEIKNDGGSAEIFRADVSEAKSVSELFEFAESTYGRLKVLVNNAGVMRLTSIAETEDRHFEDQVSINLKGTFNTMREAAERLEAGGSIVNLSSSVVGLNLERYGVYAATKAAVETMSKVFAKELRGRNIRVNSIAPGPTATELFFEGKSEELVEKLEKMSPLERIAQPEEIADSVSFLVSGEGKWVNAQVLRVNGGIV